MDARLKSFIVIKPAPTPTANELSAARTAAWIAVQEVALVGPPKLVLTAHEAEMHIENAEEFGQAQAQLVQAMRDDLQSHLSTHSTHS
jgi:hypothetical protein